MMLVWETDHIILILVPTYNKQQWLGAIGPELLTGRVVWDSKIMLIRNLQMLISNRSYSSSILYSEMSSFPADQTGKNTAWFTGNQRTRLGKTGLVTLSVKLYINICKRSLRILFTDLVQNNTMTKKTNILIRRKYSLLMEHFSEGSHKKAVKSGWLRTRHLLLKHFKDEIL